MFSSWSANKYTTSHFEGYAHALYKQEINTKDLQYRREKKGGLQPKHNNKCRLCKVNVEDITHVISSCPNMSARYYLPLRHDTIAEAVYTVLHKKEDPKAKIYCNKSEFVCNEGRKECWWNVAVKTAVKVKHNKPDIIEWDTEQKTCKIIEVSCPANVNVMSKINEKENIYGPLIRNMQLMYKDYTCMFVPIIIGALGTVSKRLESSLNELGFSKKETKNLI